MPRTKGSKNRVTATADFDAQIKKLQKDKAMLEEGLSKTVAQIEAEAAKKAEAEDVLKKLLASGVTADEILEKLK